MIVIRRLPDIKQYVAIYIMHEREDILSHSIKNHHSISRNIIHNLEIGIINDILYSKRKFYPDHRFPHVLFYSTLRQFSMPAVLLVFLHILN